MIIDNKRYKRLIKSFQKSIFRDPLKKYRTHAIRMLLDQEQFDQQDNIFINKEYVTHSNKKLRLPDSYAHKVINAITAAKTRIRAEKDRYNTCSKNDRRAARWSIKKQKLKPSLSYDFRQAVRESIQVVTEEEHKLSKLFSPPLRKSRQKAIDIVNDLTIKTEDLTLKNLKPHFAHVPHDDLEMITFLIQAERTKLNTINHAFRNLPAGYTDTILDAVDEKRITFGQIKQITGFKNGTYAYTINSDLATEEQRQKIIALVHIIEHHAPNPVPKQKQALSTAQKQIKKRRKQDSKFENNLN